MDMEYQNKLFEIIISEENYSFSNFRQHFKVWCSNETRESLSKDVESLLFTACQFGRLDVVKFLVIVQKANARTFQNQLGQTCLHIAAERGYATIVEFLILIAELDCNETDNKGNAPILTASLNGHFEVVKLLLSLGNVDVNKPNKDGNTSLHLACWKGNTEIVELLIEQGHGQININYINNNGQKPLDVANIFHHHHIVKYINKFNNSTVTSEVRQLSPSSKTEIGDTSSISPQIIDDKNKRDITTTTTTSTASSLKRSEYQRKYTPVSNQGARSGRLVANDLVFNSTDEPSPLIPPQQQAQPHLQQQFQHHLHHHHQQQEQQQKQGQQHHQMLLSNPSTSDIATNTKPDFLGKTEDRQHMASILEASMSCDVADTDHESLTDSSNSTTQSQQSQSSSPASLDTDHQHLHDHHRGETLQPDQVHYLHKRLDPLKPAERVIRTLQIDVVSEENPWATPAVLVDEEIPVVTNASNLIHTLRSGDGGGIPRVSPATAITPTMVTRQVEHQHSVSDIIVTSFRDPVICDSRNSIKALKSTHLKDKAVPDHVSSSSDSKDSPLLGYGQGSVHSGEGEAPVSLSLSGSNQGHDAMPVTTAASHRSSRRKSNVKLLHDITSSPVREIRQQQHLDRSQSAVPSHSVGLGLKPDNRSVAMPSALPVASSGRFLVSDDSSEPSRVVMGRGLPSQGLFASTAGRIEGNTRDTAVLDPVLAYSPHITTSHADDHVVWDDISVQVNYKIHSHSDSTENTSSLGNSPDPLAHVHGLAGATVIPLDVPRRTEITQRQSAAPNEESGVGEGLQNAVFTSYDDRYNSSASRRGFANLSGEAYELSNSSSESFHMDDVYKDVSPPSQSHVRGRAERERARERVNVGVSSIIGKMERKHRQRKLDKSLSVDADSGPRLDGDVSLTAASSLRQLGQQQTIGGSSIPTNDSNSQRKNPRSALLGGNNGKGNSTETLLQIEFHGTESRSYDVSCESPTVIDSDGSTAQEIVDANTISTNNINSMMQQVQFYKDRSRKHVEPIRAESFAHTASVQEVPWQPTKSLSFDKGFTSGNNTLLDAVNIPLEVESFKYFSDADGAEISRMSSGKSLGLTPSSPPSIGIVNGMNSRSSSHSNEIINPMYTTSSVYNQQRNGVDSQEYDGIQSTAPIASILPSIDMMKRFESIGARHDTASPLSSVLSSPFHTLCDLSFTQSSVVSTNSLRSGCEEDNLSEFKDVTFSNSIGGADNDQDRQRATTDNTTAAIRTSMDISINRLSANTSSSKILHLPGKGWTPSPPNLRTSPMIEDGEELNYKDTTHNRPRIKPVDASKQIPLGDCKSRDELDKHEIVPEEEHTTIISSSSSKSRKVEARFGPVYEGEGEIYQSIQKSAAIRGDVVSAPNTHNKSYTTYKQLVCKLHANLDDMQALLISLKQSTTQHHDEEVTEYEQGTDERIILSSFTPYSRDVSENNPQIPSIHSLSLIDSAPNNNQSNDTVLCDDDTDSFIIDDEDEDEGSWDLERIGLSESSSHPKREVHVQRLSASMSRPPLLSPSNTPCGRIFTRPRLLDSPTNFRNIISDLSVTPSKASCKPPLDS